MTREDKLYSLKGDMLIAECDKLGVKVSCNKSRTQLKESKSKVVDRILAFEANTAEVEETKISDTKTDEKLVPMPGIEKLETLKKEFPRHKSANNISASGEVNYNINDVLNTISKAGYVVRPYKTTPNFLMILKQDSKNIYAEVDLNKKFITVYRKTQALALNSPELISEKMLNYNYKFSYKLKYSVNYLENILRLLD